jgi:hypothetical protein
VRGGEDLHGIEMAQVDSRVDLDLATVEQIGLAGV